MNSCLSLQVFIYLNGSDLDCLCFYLFGKEAIGFLKEHLLRLNFKKILNLRCVRSGLAFFSFLVFGQIKSAH